MYFSLARKNTKMYCNLLANENQLLGIQNKQWILADGVQNPLLKSSQASFGQSIP